MAKRWSKTEISYLKKNAATLAVEEMARRLRTEPGSVRSKLTELGLGSGSAPGDDEALPVYEEALQAFHAGDHARAEELFSKVTTGADDRQLIDRARQYLTVCRRRRAEEADADPYLRVVYEKNRGDLAAARRLLDENTVEDDERYLYLAASLAALEGDIEAALSKLRAAVEREPKNRVHAYHDPDFLVLRGESEFQSILAAP